MLVIDKDNFLLDLFKLLAKHGIKPASDFKEEKAMPDVESIITERRTIKTKTLSSYRNSTDNMVNPDPKIIVDNRDFAVYALVSKSGYTLCTDADTFEHQSGFFSEHGLIWKGFSYIEEAMEWLCEEVPNVSIYKNLKIASPAYLFKYGGFWFKSGFKCDKDEIESWVYEK